MSTVGIFTRRSQRNVSNLAFSSFHSLNACFFADGAVVRINAIFGVSFDPCSQDGCLTKFRPTGETTLCLRSQGLAPCYSQGSGFEFILAMPPAHSMALDRINIFTRKLNNLSSTSYTLVSNTHPDAMNTPGVIVLCLGMVYCQHWVC